MGNEEKINELIEHFGFVIATKRLVDNRLKVRFMYRDQPFNNQDSGWRFSAGDETDEYVNDPENSGIYDIKTILEIDPDIKPYLDNPPYSAFERYSTNKPFVVVDDFDFSDEE